MENEGDNSPVTQQTDGGEIERQRDKVQEKYCEISFTKLVFKIRIIIKLIVKPHLTLFKDGFILW